MTSDHLDQFCLGLEYICQMEDLAALAPVYTDASQAARRETRNFELDELYLMWQPVCHDQGPKQLFYYLIWFYNLIWFYFCDSQPSECWPIQGSIQKMGKISMCAVDPYHCQLIFEPFFSAVHNHVRIQAPRNALKLNVGDPYGTVTESLMGTNDLFLHANVGTFQTLELCKSQIELELCEYYAFI